MSDPGNGNGNGSKFAAMVDNVIAKFIARYLMPLVGTAAMALAAFVLNQFRDEAAKTRTHLEVLTAIASEVKTGLAVINADLAGQREHVKEIADRLRSDVDSTARFNGQRLDEHDRRLTQHDRQIDLLNGRHLP